MVKILDITDKNVLKAYLEELGVPDLTDSMQRIHLVKRAKKYLEVSDDLQL